MTVANVTEARDEILTVFRTAWMAGSPSNTIPVLYPDVDKPAPSEGHYARVSVQHTNGFKATLSNRIGERRFRKVGFVTVQIFTVRGNGLVLSDQLAQIGKDAFEGARTPGGVIFRDVQTPEIGPDGIWFHRQVVANFEYDEVR